MIRSMTGYATANREIVGASLTVEVKSVNGRFLDLQFRLPDELRAIEPALRELIAAVVTRGKVECRIALNPNANAAATLKLNRSLLQELAALDKEVRVTMPESRPLRVGDVLHWPGMLGDDAELGDQRRAAAVEAMRTALQDFSASRAREGAKLKALIMERVVAMETLLAEVRPKLPEAVAAFQEKMTTRLRDALGSADDERIRQEIALYGVKIDVAEEMGRLGAHLSEVRRILDAGGPAGKRLDFLMQELNREANTLGSKMVSKELSDASVEFKIAIEQIREQVQNIE